MTPLLHLPPIHELGITNVETETWVTRRDGELQPINVADLTHRHRTHLLAYLRRNAGVLWSHHRHLLRQLWMLQLVDDREFGDRVAHLDRTPAPEWLEDTALVRRLVALTPAEPRPPRRHRLLPARLLSGGRR